MQEHLVSVIVTVYNLEKQIHKCISSILAQTHVFLQIVIVDDGSTDNSGLICDRLAGTDSRIHVIHRENGGLVSARKTGILAAAGDFTITVDADDWIEPNYVEDLLTAQSRTGAAIVAAGHFHDIGVSSVQIRNSISNGFYAGHEISARVLYSGIFFEYGIQPHICNKLFKTSLLRRAQLQVDERIMAGEDAAVVYPALLECDGICVSNDVCGYHYVQHQGSMTKTPDKNDMARFRILLDYLKNVFKEKGMYEIMEPQLEQYKKYLLLLRNPGYLGDKLIKPYGELVKNPRIVIYGAGVSGQRLYQYFRNKVKVQIVKWIDKNYESYVRNDFAVEPPSSLMDEDLQYDYILIANTSASVVSCIKADLEKLNVKQEKVRWLSKEFLDINYRIDL